MQRKLKQTNDRTSFWLGTKLRISRRKRILNKSLVSKHPQSVTKRMKDCDISETCGSIQWNTLNSSKELIDLFFDIFSIWFRLFCLGSFVLYRLSILYVRCSRLPKGIFVRSSWHSFVNLVPNAFWLSYLGLLSVVHGDAGRSRRWTNLRYFYGYFRSFNMDKNTHMQIKLILWCFKCYGSVLPKVILVHDSEALTLELCS